MAVETNSSDGREIGEAANLRLLVVFPCLNEAEHIEKLVRFFAHSLQKISATLVIVDGGSSDATPNLARRLANEISNVRFIENVKRLQSAAINLAVQKCGDDADYVIRIDAHGDYPEKYCQTLVSEAVSHDADSVVVGMHTKGLTKFQSAVALAQNSVLGNGGSRHRAGVGKGAWVDHGHHALMRIAAFRSVGGYDEEFSHNEDAELDHRLKLAGFKIWLTTAATMIYYPRSQPWPLLRQYFNYGNGRAKNITKNRIRMKVRQLLPAFVLPAVLFVVLFPLWWGFALPACAWAVLCMCFGALVAYRKGRYDLALLVGPAAMIMHLGWSAGFLCFLLFNRRN